MIPFRRRLTLDQRRAEFERIRVHRRTRVPVIVEAGTINAAVMDKEKFLVPFDLTVAQFLFLVRRRTRDLESSKALFLLIGGEIPLSSVTMSELYDRHASDDGFLYVVYTTENTFG